MSDSPEGPSDSSPGAIVHSDELLNRFVVLGDAGLRVGERFLCE